jgi:diacylglycerol kinase family enzyme
MLAQGGNGPQLDDGLLDVTVVTNVDSKADALGVLRDLLLDTDTPGDAKADGIRAQTRNEDDSNVWHRRGKRIRIETDPPQKMVVDGEVGDRTPATFEVNSGALQVLVDPETEV